MRVEFSVDFGCLVSDDQNIQERKYVVFLDMAQC
jgi:hypothetical protein